MPVAASRCGSLGRMVGRPCNAEPLHQERRVLGIETEFLGGVSLAVDLPVTAFEHLANVRALNVVQPLEGEGSGRGVGREGQHLLGSLLRLSSGRSDRE